MGTILFIDRVCAGYRIWVFTKATCSNEQVAFKCLHDTLLFMRGDLKLFIGAINCLHIGIRLFQKCEQGYLIFLKVTHIELTTGVLLKYNSIDPLINQLIDY
ncbi:hypothetical protein D3C72_1596600 [compost metagenome]